MLPSLTNFEIDVLVNTAGATPFYMGCYSKDTLACQGPKEKFAIVNHENENQNGSHWTLVYACKNQPNIYCFDSMGSPPPTEVLKWARKCKKKYNKDIVYSALQLQPVGTNSCGWFCLYVAVHLLRDWSMQKILSEFTVQPNLNEHMLFRFFEQTFKNMDKIRSMAHTLYLESNSSSSS
jgi:hypothetical protein